MKTAAERLLEKRMDQVKGSYATFTASTGVALAAKRERLHAFAQERLWRAAQMRALEMGQAQAVHDIIVKDVIEACERATAECKEKALNECVEEIRKLEDKEDKRSIPLKKTTESNNNAIVNGDDEDSDAIPNSVSIATNRPRRNNLQQTTGMTSSSTMVNTNLNTMLTEAEIWDDLQLVFPGDVNKAGYMKRQAKVGTSNVDIRVEGSVAWCQGQRFVKGDRIKVRCSDQAPSPPEFIYVGHISGSEFGGDHVEADQS